MPTNPSDEFQFLTCNGRWRLTRRAPPDDAPVSEITAHAVLQDALREPGFGAGIVGWLSDHGPHSLMLGSDIPASLGWLMTEIGSRRLFLFSGAAPTGLGDSAAGREPTGPAPEPLVQAAPAPPPSAPPPPIQVTAPAATAPRAAREAPAPDPAQPLLQLIRDLPPPTEKVVDGDIEDALWEAGFVYPKKTIWIHESHPGFVIKTNDIDTRLQAAQTIRATLRANQIDTVVIPQKRLVAPTQFTGRALVIDKFDIEDDIEANRQFYQELTVEEAASVTFALMKTRARDIDAGDNALENLPRIRGTRQLVIIDTGGGTVASDREMVEIVNGFVTMFSPPVTARFRRITTEDLQGARRPSDLLA